MVLPQKGNYFVHTSSASGVLPVVNKNNSVIPHRMRNLSAFTLIELLVVVLIIGILAAIAVPQYQKVVEKSKASQALAIIRTVAAAQENYYMANGTYARNFNDLAVDIPWTGDTRVSSHSSSGQARSNEHWSVQIYSESVGIGIVVGRLSGPYAGGGFLYLLDPANYDLPTHTLLCREGSTFTRNAGDYCKKIWGATRIMGTSTRYYQMP